MSSSLNANLTSITHIPEARLVITVRIEASLFSRSLTLDRVLDDVVYPTAYLTVEDGGRPCISSPTATRSRTSSATSW